MRFVITAILLALSGVVIVQLYNLYSKQLALIHQSREAATVIEKLQDENSQLKSDMEYFSDPRNVAKELKSKFNYKEPGETMIIVIPEE